MKCPRCKEENTEESTVCSGCKLKLKSACPRCKSLNRIGQSVCTNCNLRLIRFCPQCKTPNFPGSPTCRKCGIQLLKKKKPVPQNSTQVKPVNKPVTKTAETVTKSRPGVAAKAADITQKPQKPASVAPKNASDRSGKKADLSKKQAEVINNVILKKSEKLLSRTEAQDMLTNLMKTSETGVLFDITALDGAGKSSLLSSVAGDLKDQKFIWLVGLCMPMHRLLPYSFIQDMLKTFLGLPLYALNVKETTAKLKTVLETNLDIHNPQINDVLLRILLNDFKDCSSSIIENKEVMHKTILLFMDELKKQNNLSIIIEDIEYIDDASLECIKYLVNKGFLNSKSFIFVNRQPNMDLHKIFPLESIKNKILTIHFKSMTQEELNSAMLLMLNNRDIIPKKIKTKIFDKARDVPLYLEQVLWYLFQTGAITLKGNSPVFNPQAENIQIPDNLDDLIAARINLINKVSPDATKVILVASLFGLKFISPFLLILSETEEQQFNQIIQMLINTGIFITADSMSLRFKHSRIWRTLYEKIFTDEQIYLYSPRLIELYEKYTPTISSSVLARHAEEAGLKKETYEFYTRAAEECICLGDITSYDNYLKQMLDFLPETDLTDEQKAEIRTEITEQSGRANYEVNPQAAMRNLADSIEKAESLGQYGKSYRINGIYGKKLRNCRELYRGTGMLR